MISIDDILDVLEASVRDTLPDEKEVHRNLLPKNAARPCSLLEVEDAELKQVNAGLYERVFSVKITTLAETDERHYSHLPDVDARMLALMGVFSNGYLRVKDRALKVQSCEGSSNYDFATVAAILTVTLAKEDLQAADIPMMQELFLQTKHQNGGTI